MSVIEQSKLAIIGAGAVGTSLAYAAMIRESAREIALYDIRTEKVAAEVLDLAHGSQFTGVSRIQGSDDLDVVQGSNVVVITAGLQASPLTWRIAAPVEKWPGWGSGTRRDPCCRREQSSRRR